MSSILTKRLSKELKELHEKGCPIGISIISTDTLNQWSFELEAYDSIYNGEKFALLFRFFDGYPIDSPAVQFIVNDKYKAPVHPHVYTNGHICASILADGWSPVLNVSAICLTIQSMLTSCSEKKLPPDNANYVARAPDNPKKTRWEFHDDNV